MIVAAENTGPHFKAVGRVLDDFHDAAAHGNKERYLSHLTEHAVYIGTDEWERWPKHPDFSEYVDGRCRGTGILTRQSGKWQLEHYAMSFLILNENWDEVIELISC